MEPKTRKRKVEKIKSKKGYAQKYCRQSRESVQSVMKNKKDLQKKKVLSLVQRCYIYATNDFSYYIVSRDVASYATNDVSFLNK